MRAFAAWFVIQIWPEGVPIIRDCVRLVVRHMTPCDRAMIYEAACHRAIGVPETIISTASGPCVDLLFDRCNNFTTIRCHDIVLAKRIFARLNFESEKINWVGLHVRYGITWCDELLNTPIVLTAAINSNNIVLRDKMLANGVVPEWRYVYYTKENWKWLLGKGFDVPTKSKLLYILDSLPECERSEFINTFSLEISPGDVISLGYPLWLYTPEQLVAHMHSAAKWWPSTKALEYVWDSPKLDIIAMKIVISEDSAIDFIEKSPPRWRGYILATTESRESFEVVKKLNLSIRWDVFWEHATPYAVELMNEVFQA